MTKDTNQIVGNVNQGNSDSGNNGNTPPAPTPLSVVASKAGDEITISVQDGEDTLVSQIVPFAKNSTQVYDVGGYTVQIVYNGGGVKTAEILGGSFEPGNDNPAPTPPNPTVPTGLSVATSMSGNDVTISVQNAESVLTTTIVPFAKNSTQIYDVGGYNVEVVYNGGKVKFVQLVEESTEPTEPSEPTDPIHPTEPGNGNTKYPVTGTFQYDFDDLYRVIEAYEPNKDQTWFTYDSLGNLVKEVGGSGVDKNPIIYQYNNLSQLLQWTQKGDMVVFDYDERGNLISEVGPVSLNIDSQYTYDGTNRLVEGINWKGDKSQYTYNGLGWRVNQTEIMHSGSTEVREYVLDYTSATRRDLVIYKPGQTTQRHVYANGSRVEQITEHGSGNSGNGNMERLLYVHSGVMGTSIRYSKDNGQQFASMDFDLFGWVLSPNMLVNNDNGVDVVADFTGYTFDTVLDKYFAQHRFYDAFNRRFMAEDPIKDGLNWYAYVGNNPVTFVDPLGLLESDTVIAGVDVESGSTHVWDPGDATINTLPDPLPKLRDVRPIIIDERAYIRRTDLILGGLVAGTEPLKDDPAYANGSVTHTAKNVASPHGMYITTNVDKKIIDTPDNYSDTPEGFYRAESYVLDRIVNDIGVWTYDPQNHSTRQYMDTIVCKGSGEIYYDVTDLVGYWEPWGFTTWMELTHFIKTQDGYQRVPGQVRQSNVMMLASLMSTGIQLGVQMEGTHGWGTNNSVANNLGYREFYYQIELEDSKGRVIGEFDGINVRDGVFIGDKSAQGLNVVNPRTGLPVQNAQQWAQKQIVGKTNDRIAAIQSASGARTTPTGSPVAPSLSEIQKIKTFVFMVEGDSPDLVVAVQDAVNALSQANPGYQFIGVTGIIK